MISGWGWEGFLRKCHVCFKHQNQEELQSHISSLQ